MKKTLKWRLAQAVELKWWKNYLKNKDKSSYLSWKQQYWKSVLQNIDGLALSLGDIVLDAGCGPAGIFMVLKEQSIVAVDPLLAEYTKTLTHFSESDYPHTTFKNEPLEEYKKIENFDYVFCMNAINHVSDMQLCIKNLVQSTKKGGQIIVSIDAHNHDFFKKVFRLLPGDILHPHQYDLKEYASFFTKENCSLQQIKCIKNTFFFDHYLLVFRRKN